MNQRIHNNEILSNMKEIIHNKGICIILLYMKSKYYFEIISFYSNMNEKKDSLRMVVDI